MKNFQAIGNALPISKKKKKSQFEKKTEYNFPRREHYITSGKTDYSVNSAGEIIFLQEKNTKSLPQTIKQTNNSKSIENQPQHF